MRHIVMWLALLNSLVRNNRWSDNFTPKLFIALQRFTTVSQEYRSGVSVSFKYCLKLSGLVYCIQTLLRLCAHVHTPS